VTRYSCRGSASGALTRQSFRRSSTWRDASVRTAAGQGSVAMAGPHRAGQSLAAQPGSAEILIADAIGDTLPERVMEFG